MASKLSGVSTASLGKFDKKLKAWLHLRLAARALAHVTASSGHMAAGREARGKGSTGHAQEVPASG